MLSKVGKGEIGKGRTYAPRIVDFGKVECERVDLGKVCWVLGEFCSELFDRCFHRGYIITSTHPVSQTVMCGKGTVYACREVRDVP